MKRIALLCLLPGGSFCAMAQAAHCLQLTRAIVRGEALSMDALEPAACPDTVVHVLYDRDARLVRALRDMAAGEAIAAVPPQRMAIAVRGQPVRIRHRVGAVSVTRQGTALIDVPPGQQVAAMTADGQLIRGLPLQGSP